MIVCPRCKAENAEGRIRCGKCGNNISKRGEFAETQGPKVVVLGSVEDLKRAREQGDLDTSDDDPTALGWLDSTETSKLESSSESGERRRVSVSEIDKISGLKDLREIQKALLGSDEPEPEKPRLKIERGGLRGGSTEGDSSSSMGRPLPKEELVSPPRPEEPAPVETEPAAAYLACELFADAFPLVATRKYLLGRDQRASICLPSSEVSRRHAGVSMDDKGAFWIEDLKSMNGTYVNGHAVLKRKLKAGDRIDMGPFAFIFSLAEKGAPPPSGGCDPEGETQPVRMVPGALSGEIEKNGVGPVLRLLHASRRSGVLTLRAGRQVGRVFIVQGEIHHAQFGKSAGEAALSALIPAEAGLLHFTDEKVKVHRSIERSTEEILGASS